MLEFTWFEKKRDILMKNNISKNIWQKIVVPFEINHSLF